MPLAQLAAIIAVLSTGVYCRPSCPSRPARRENVRFHASAEAAEAAGFRAGKRCHPRDTASEPRLSALAVRVARLIEGAERPPTLSYMLIGLVLSSLGGLAILLRRLWHYWRQGEDHHQRMDQGRQAQAD